MFNIICLCTITAFGLLGGEKTAMAKQESSNAKQKEIRTYISFSSPVDPAQVFTIPDMDVSYALGSTLVDWDESKSIVSGIASKWTRTGEKSFRFHLNKNAKWSDGSAVSCNDVKRSFARAKKDYGESLKSLFDRVESIRCINTEEVQFDLTEPDHDGSFLRKLTEPMYGILKIKADGKPDLSVSSGPFILENSSDAELVMRRNPHWYNFTQDLAEQVIIRKPPSDSTDLQSALINDEWPNLIATHSLMKGNLSEKFSRGKFGIWKRSLDRVFYFSFLGTSKLSESKSGLCQFLLRNLDRKTLTDDLGGFTEGSQMFPSGYPIHDPKFQARGKEGSPTLPSEFKTRALRILISPERVSSHLQSNLSKAIEKATGQKPEFVKVALSQLHERIKTQDFDFYAGSLGVSDPNYDGALSYLFESEPAVIPSGKGNRNFIDRLNKSRQIKDAQLRISELRSLMSDAVYEGHVLPLFHFSTTVIARPEIDLSEVPTTDESVSFSKVRFKGLPR